MRPRSTSACTHASWPTIARPPIYIVYGCYATAWLVCTKIETGETKSQLCTTIYSLARSISIDRMCVRIGETKGDGRNELHSIAGRFTTRRSIHVQRWSIQSTLARAGFDNVSKLSLLRVPARSPHKATLPSSSNAYKPSRALHSTEGDKSSHNVANLQLLQVFHGHCSQQIAEQYSHNPQRTVLSTRRGGFRSPQSGAQ